MPCTRRPRLLIGRAASLFKQWPNFGEFTKDEARRSGRQAAGRITIIPDFVRMQAVTSVQQPCSNPSKSPETSGKVLLAECCYLQAVCTHLKDSANLRAALAWRRPGVRVSSGPLPFCGDLQVKRDDQEKASACYDGAHDGECEQRDEANDHAERVCLALVRKPRTERPGHKGQRDPARKQRQGQHHQRPRHPGGGAGAHPTDPSIPFLCSLGHDTTLQHYRLPGVTAAVTRSRVERTS